MNAVTDATDLLMNSILPGLVAIDSKLLAVKEKLDALLANQNDPAAEQALKDAVQAVSEESSKMLVDANALIPAAPVADVPPVTP